MRHGLEPERYLDHSAPIVNVVDSREVVPKWRDRQEVALAVILSRTDVRAARSYIFLAVVGFS